MESNWQDVKGFEGLYQVNDKGELRSLDRAEVFKNKNGNTVSRIRKGRIMKLSVDNDGYLVTGLFKDNNRTNIKIHRLVAEHFITNPEDKEHVNHIDGDKANNSVTNLEWATPQENITHAVVTELRNDKGIHNNNAKLSLEDIEYIRDNYKPRDKEFGAKALAKKFNVHSLTIGRVAK